MDKGYLRIRGTKLGHKYKIANVPIPDHAGGTAFEIDESFDNAAFIVRACNAHDDLVQSLALAIADLEFAIAIIGPKYPDRAEQISISLNTQRAALAKAQV